MARFKMIRIPRSRNFIVVQDWLGLTDYDTTTVMDLIDDLADDRDIDLNDVSANILRDLADDAFHIANEECML